MRARAAQSRPKSETRYSLREGYRHLLRLTVLQGESSSALQTIPGVSSNLTPTGVRIRVSRKILVGARCRVAFQLAAGRVTPEIVEGTVRNSHPVRASDGEFEIGIEFDRPVRIKQPGKL